MSTPPPPPYIRRNTTTDPSAGSPVPAAYRSAPPVAGRRGQVRAGALRRTSMLGPLLLIGLGTCLLLAEFGLLSAASIWNWMARWWPCILIGSGVVLVAEWGYDKEVARRQGTPVIRRRLGGGAVLLLVAAAVLGSLSFVLPQAHRRFTGTIEPDMLADIGLNRMFGTAYSGGTELSASFAPKSLLAIENFRGSIRVSGTSQDGKVHVQAQQHLLAWNDAELESKKQRYRPTLTLSGGGLLLKAGGDGRDQTDLEVQVPHESAVAFTSEDGEITVDELRGEVTVADHRGPVSLTAMTGAVHLAMRDDGAVVTAHSLTGDLTLKGRSGDVSLSDITGTTNLQGDFFGTTHLERLAGPLHFQSSFTTLDCKGVPGELRVEGRSELEAHHLQGPVTLTTTDRNITMTAIHGSASVTDRNGSVTLGMGELGGPTRVETTNGSIELMVDGSPFAVDAQTADGEITNDFGLASSKNDDRAILHGQVGHNGAPIALHTNDGDIHLKRSTEVSQTKQADSF